MSKQFKSMLKEWLALLAFMAFLAAIGLLLGWHHGVLA